MFTAIKRFLRGIFKRRPPAVKELYLRDGTPYCFVCKVYHRRNQKCKEK